jgi:hypothetical protein
MVISEFLPGFFPEIENSPTIRIGLNVPISSGSVPESLWKCSRE